MIYFAYMYTSLFIIEEFKQDWNLKLETDVEVVVGCCLLVTHHDFPIETMATNPETATAQNGLGPPVIDH